MSIAVPDVLNPEIFSRFSSFAFAKLCAEKAMSSADARALFTKTLDLANLISDWFFINNTVCDL
jgi:hypothetical protein